MIGPPAAGYKTLTIQILGSEHPLAHLSVQLYGLPSVGDQGADDIGSYRGFIPAAPDFRTPLDPATLDRYSDEQYMH